MNIKKIGLTALAASLVSVSANAGALTAAGPAAEVQEPGEEDQAAGRRGVPRPAARAARAPRRATAGNAAAPRPAFPLSVFRQAVLVHIRVFSLPFQASFRKYGQVHILFFI